MDVVIILVFISLGLVAASLFFFVHRLKEGDFDHAERLALAPLDNDPPPFLGDRAAGDDETATAPAPVAADCSQADNHGFQADHGFQAGNHSLQGSTGGSSHARCRSANAARRLR